MLLVPAVALATALLVDPSAPPPGIADLEAALRATAGVTFGATSRSPSAMFLALDPSLVPDDLLVAVLLSGATTRDPVEVARAMLGAAQGDLAQVHRSDLVRDTPGVGDVGRARLLAAHELARRAAYRVVLAGSPRVNSPLDAARIFRTLLPLDTEWVTAIYLDRKHRVLGHRVLTRGSAVASIVDAGQVLRPALEMSASGVILGHNHPSGDPDPSANDLVVTHRVRDAAQVVGVTLLDHLVLAGTQFVSLSERGEI